MLDHARRRLFSHLAAIALALAGAFAPLLSFSQIGAGEVSTHPELQGLAPEQKEEKVEAAKVTGPAGLSKAMQFQVSKYAPVNPYYILGPNDQIIINLWGKKNQTFNVVVDDSGWLTLKIEMPEPAGRAQELRIAVNGMYFKDLKSRITRELAKVTSDIDADHPESSKILVDVNLGAIRGITVLVVGEVNNPGQVTLNTTISSVFNALAKAGGPTEEASLREIIVRRPGGMIENVDLLSFDLYALMVKGEVDEELFHLRDGDIVIVPPRRGIVSVQGTVRRPGYYEMRTTETLQSIIEVAGGFTPFADRERINILRTRDEKGARFMAVSYSMNPDFGLMDGDQIECTSKPLTRRLNLVEVKGDGIRKPGSYEYREGMILKDLIEKAGGLFEDAVLDSAVFVRTQEDYTLDFSTLDLTSIIKGEAAPIALKPKDKLIVYSKFYEQGGEKFVNIAGQVKVPGAYALAAKMSLADLIFMAGGFGDKDYLKTVYLERGDLFRREAGGAEVCIPFKLGRLLANDPAENQPLQSEDSVRIYSISEIEGQKRVSAQGHVKHPAIYGLTKGMKVMDLLFLAGGFDDPDFVKTTYLERADLTRIDSASHQRKIIPINLRKVLSGDEAENIALESLDALNVYAFDEFQDLRLVSIEGEVRKPGKYALTENMTLGDLISLANGLTSKADAQRIEIARFPEPDSKGPQAAKIIAVPFATAETQPVPLMSQDRVLVRRKQEMTPRNTVALAGQVVYPGSYVLASREETVSDVIDRAGGFMKSAAPEAAYLVRRTKAADDALLKDDSETTTAIPAEPTTITVALSLPKAMRDRHGEFDLPLLDGDEVHVPETNWMVEVQGQVFVPRALQYVKGESAGYYIQRVGGYAPSARKGDTLIVYPNGEARKANYWFFFSRSVQPGSVIYVPSEEESGPLMRAPAIGSTLVKTSETLALRRGAGARGPEIKAPKGKEAAAKRSKGKETPVKEAPGAQAAGEEAAAREAPGQAAPSAEAADARNAGKGASPKLSKGKEAPGAMSEAYKRFAGKELPAPNTSPYQE